MGRERLPGGYENTREKAQLVYCDVDLPQNRYLSGPRGGTSARRRRCRVEVRSSAAAKEVRQRLRTGGAGVADPT